MVFEASFPDPEMTWMAMAVACNWSDKGRGEAATVGRDVADGPDKNGSNVDDGSPHGIIAAQFPTKCRTM